MSNSSWYKVAETVMFTYKKSEICVIKSHESGMPMSFIAPSENGNANQANVLYCHCKCEIKRR